MLVRHFLPFAKQFAKLRPGADTRPPLVGSALAPRMQEPKKFCKRRRLGRNRGQRSQRSSFGFFYLFLGRAGRSKSREFFR